MAWQESKFWLDGSENMLKYQEALHEALDYAHSRGFDIAPEPIVSGANEFDPLIEAVRDFVWSEFRAAAKPLDDFREKAA